MPSLTNFDNRITGLIQSSGLTLSVIYPSARQAATGTAPGSAPLNPLTGSSTPTVFPSEPTPIKPAIVLKCLWYDLPSGLSGAPGDERFEYLQIGQVAGATALARVLVSEAAVDKAKPYGPTVLTDAERVEYLGMKFEIIQVTPMSSGRSVPISYHCWLKGTK